MTDNRFGIWYAVVFLGMALLLTSLFFPWLSYHGVSDEGQQYAGSIYMNMSNNLLLSFFISLLFIFSILNIFTKDVKIYFLGFLMGYLSFMYIWWTFLMEFTNIIINHIDFTEEGDLLFNMGISINVWVWIGLIGIAIFMVVEYFLYIYSTFREDLIIRSISQNDLEDYIIRKKAATKYALKTSITPIIILLSVFISIGLLIMYGEFSSENLHSQLYSWISLLGLVFFALGLSIFVVGTAFIWSQNIDKKLCCDPYITQVGKSLALLGLLLMVSFIGYHISISYIIRMAFISPYYDPRQFLIYIDSLFLLSVTFGVFVIVGFYRLNKHTPLKNKYALPLCDRDNYPLKPKMVNGNPVWYCEWCGGYLDIHAKNAVEVSSLSLKEWEDRLNKLNLVYNQINSLYGQGTISYKRYKEMKQDILFEINKLRL